MANTCRICITPQCGEEATHVLLTRSSLHGGHWPREATRADQAPQVITNRIVLNQDPNPIVTGTPTPYYCREHAEERSHA